MKKIGAISFLVVFLSANTAFGQLWQLPTLFHHYFEHARQDHYSLVEFLSKHYSEKIDHPDDKHHDHEKLPFKAVGCQSTQVFTLFPVVALSVAHEFPCLVKVNAPVLEKQCCSNAYLNSIWQPPRFS